MKINDEGHVVNHDGKTTEPMKSPYWMGDDTLRVAFDFLWLDNGSLAIHSLFGNAQAGEMYDFIYEVVSAEDLETAILTMIDDAEIYLSNLGALVDKTNANKESIIEHLIYNKAA